MKVFFMGTPEFAVESLKALLQSDHTVVGVATQPDSALKRGRIQKSPVKEFSEKHGLTVIQPKKIKESIELIRAFGADIGVTAAYGQLLNSEVLQSFKYGVINVHASLLPKYRGASPIFAAIANGETVTGVTIMQTELGLDSGDILVKKELGIGSNETAGRLTQRLAELGAAALIEVLNNYNAISPIKQDDSLATHCRVITKQQTVLNFDRVAQDVCNTIRALSPLPCAKTTIDGDIYRIYAAKPLHDVRGAAGEIVCCDNRLVIACKQGGIEVLRIQAPSKRELDITEFLRGKKFKVGTVCG